MPQRKIAERSATLAVTEMKGFMMSFIRFGAAMVCAIALASSSVMAQSSDTTYPESDPRWIGTVTHCDGDATLYRGEHAYQVVRGAGLRLGDTLETAATTKLTLATKQGPAITMGGAAVVTLNRSGDQWLVDLDRGQARLVHDGESKLHLTSPDAEMWLERAIVQVDQSERTMRYELVAGSVLHRLDAGSMGRNSQRGSYQVRAEGSLQSASPIAWNFQAAQVRLAAALQTSPMLQPPATSTPGGVTGSPSDVFPPADGLSPTDPLFPEEEDDDDPRFAQDPLTPDQTPGATRGGFDDGGNADMGIGASTNTFAGSSSLSLGSLSSATGTFASGGIFGDANQQTFQGQVDYDIKPLSETGPFTEGDPFPGAIHLVTAENRLPFSNVQLSSAEFSTLFSGAADKFFSIGTGAAPSSQVLTNFFTGTGATPTVIDIPGFDSHLIQLDQYNIPDPAQGALDSNIGLTGLIGADPTGPTVVGDTPLVDERAQFNSGATFALGEFLVTSDGGSGITFTIRRSDQDRLIVKDPGGNDANDLVQPNTDVTFTDDTDPRFLPQSPTVKVPESVANTGVGVKELNFLRRAAFTTLVADQLQDYSRRTGQTRFVVDGKIIDISGFQPTR
ncbi:secreted protein [Rhodopirellula maiorica SM1]|uniref:Secreted protein n=2 Tax=Novipirellula TaxID=2795426 RepID=M5RMD7_9BACT|nr:secreted protein [Rhodopirellula maiorica SM1]